MVMQILFAPDPPFNKKKHLFHLLEIKHTPDKTKQLADLPFTELHVIHLRFTGLHLELDFDWSTF